MTLRPALHRLPGWQDLLTALAYAALGWGSLKIAIPPDYVSLVFLPAGLAVAAVLMRGSRALGGVFLGALLVQLIARQQVGLHAWTWTLGVPAVGATLQAGATAWAMRRWLGFPDHFDTPKSVLGFMLLVVPLGSAINACVSVPTLAASGVIPWSEAPYSAWTWWNGDALGVALLVPLVLTLVGSPAHLWRPRIRTVALPMALALALVLGAVSLVRVNQEATLQARFQRESDDALQRLQHRFDALTDAADAIAVAVQLSPTLDADRFRALTQPWLERYPGILNFGWSPLVSHRERSAFEDRQRRQLLQPFQVKGRSPDGRTFPAAPAPEYLPLTLIEPLARNAQVRGLDVLVLPATASAARCALTSLGGCATEPLRLVQETGAQKGVVLYKAVRSDASAGAEPTGVVSVALRMDEFSEATLSAPANESGFLSLCVVDLDGPPGQQVLIGEPTCDTAAGPGPAATMGLAKTTALRFGQQDWVLRVNFGPRFLSQTRDWTAWAVTAISLGAVGLLGAFLLVITGQNRRTQLLVDERTRELSHSNASLLQLAHYDPLTGLFNRARWSELAQRTLDDSRIQDSPLGVLFIDLDRFKHINDSLGHSHGDLLLCTLAHRMTSCLRGRDVLARLGGDEFVVLLPRLRDRHGARRAGEKLLQALAQPVDLAGQTVTVSASIGVACWPEDGDSIEALVRNADIAMYAAKDSGRNTLRFFSTELQEQLSEHLLLERELRRALSDNPGELRLVYQPQIHLGNSRVMGLEALLRWQHPTLGAICPDRFIPVAEQCGLIEEVDRWVLRQCCEQLRRWEEQGLPPLRVAVNISAQHIGRAEFLPQLEHILRISGPTAQRIELEITESLLMQGQTEVREHLLSLTRLGPTLALDDFGTGYSNLGYLKRLPLDKLKIDRSFLVDVPGKPEDEALVRAIVSVAHDLGLQVLAEGVETVAQRDFLRRLGCDLMQGWLESRALPVPELEHWLQERHRRFGSPERAWAPAEPAMQPA